MKRPARPPVLMEENWEIWSLWEMFSNSISPGAYGYPMPLLKDFIYVSEWMGYRKNEIMENWETIQMICRLLFSKKKKTDEGKSDDKGVKKG
jgi:hypothetical protein